MDIPERFKIGDEDEEEEEDNPALVQQSVYGMIIAGATKTNAFPETIQTDSESDSEGDNDPPRTIPDTPVPMQAQRIGPEKNTPFKSKGLLRSPTRSVREQNHKIDPMTQSQILPRKESLGKEPRRRSSAEMHSDAPALDRRLQAQARAHLESMNPLINSRKSKDAIQPVNLGEALKDIFHFEEPEDVISEFPCSYLQNVLLQGYMYITERHICFYAYLPRKGNVTIKSGHLAKQGKRDPRYSRHWFLLKGDVLSYYASAAEPYFPIGTIDLRYGITAELAPGKASDGDAATAFTITTDKRTYYLKADSSTSAKEWVKQLQKVIFRSHNDGDSVKISLPIANILDVESNPVIDFADTIKMRVIDNDETYAVDDYFFTFFRYGKQALDVLAKVTKDKTGRKDSTNAVNQSENLQSATEPPKISLGRSSPILGTRAQASVRRTVSSFKTATGKSEAYNLDHPSTSLEHLPSSFAKKAHRGISPLNQRGSAGSFETSAQESSDSFNTSTEHLESPTGHDERYDPMTASQILSDDGAFGAPTLQAPRDQRVPSIERLHAKQDSRLRGEHVPFQSSTRPHGEQKLHDKRDHQLAQSTSTSRPAMSVLANPIQHALSLAEQVRNGSKRMGSYLSSSPKDYYTKFSGAIAGGKRHYTEAHGLSPEDRIDDPDDDLDAAEHERRFHQHFSLPSSEKLVAVFYCWLHRVLPLYGKIYISNQKFCFRSLIYGTKSKLIIPFKDIDTLEKEKGFRFRYPGMCVVIRGHEEVFFDFASQDLRDDCVVTVLRALESQGLADGSFAMSGNDVVQAEAAAAEHQLLQDARQDDYDDQHMEPRQRIDFSELEGESIVFDDPTASLLDFTPKDSLRITCLTIGSRGDVQPYVALGKRLIAEGHHVRIATHARFKGFVEQHGIEFAPVAGDPEDLMQICVDYGLFTPGFLYEGSKRFRPWLQALLESAWTACQGSELLIESPSTMAGIHIAEAMEIPYFRAFTMPWTRTRAFPHAFMDPTKRMGGQFNYMTYGLIDNVFWRFTSGEINAWRAKTMGLKPTSLEKMQMNKIPFLYNFSPHVVVPPLDYSDWVRITGYWFLDESDGKYTPPRDLTAFIKQARDDGMKLVYIGFGSVTVNDSKQLTQQIIDAVLKADVRCILSKGWSDHFDKNDGSVPVATFPSCIFQIRAAPHDWLFPQMDAVVHHGGAGTTGAGLRAGIPTVIKPFFGDQFFFAMRAQDLGVGLYVKKVSVNALGRAIWIASHDDRMKARARRLGEQIRNEDGVGTAIKAIYRDLDYARTLIKSRHQRVGNSDPEEDEVAEESWTFVENDREDAVVAAAKGLDMAVTKNKPADRGLDGRRSLGDAVLRGRLG